MGARGTLQSAVALGVAAGSRPPHPPCFTSPNMSASHGDRGGDGTVGPTQDAAPALPGADGGYAPVGAGARPVPDTHPVPWAVQYYIEDPH